MTQTNQPSGSDCSKCSEEDCDKPRYKKPNGDYSIWCFKHRLRYSLAVYFE